MRACIKLFGFAALTAVLASHASEPASANACIATPALCRAGDSPAACAERRSSARAAFEACRSQQDSTQAARQAEAARERKRERDKADAERRDRDRERENNNRLLLEQNCAVKPCDRR